MYFLRTWDRENNLSRVRFSIVRIRSWRSIFHTIHPIFNSNQQQTTSSPRIPVAISSCFPSAWNIYGNSRSSPPWNWWWNRFSNSDVAHQFPSLRGIRFSSAKERLGDDYSTFLNDSRWTRLRVTESEKSAISKETGDSIVMFRHIIKILINSW